jgi:hypothetical protein
MKKISLIFIAIAAVLLLGTCSSFKPAKKPTVVNLKWEKLPAGSAEGQTERFFSMGGLKKSDIDVFYYPEGDVAQLMFKVDFVTFYLFWSRENREIFINALETYKGEYERREILVNKNTKTRRAYGEILALLMWQTTSLSTLGISSPKVEVGYYFKNRLPYFGLTVKEAKNENDQSKDAMKTSQGLTLYFTRAQAEGIALLFDQEFLEGVGLGPRPSGVMGVEGDLW